MADVVMLVGGGVTELQILEAQIANLNRQVEGVKRAENASSACAQVIASIQKAEEKDGFVGDNAVAGAGGGGPEGGAGGVAQANQYHSGASGGSNGGGGAGAGQPEGGCCTVM
jgi:hypothetical protein